MPPRPVEVDAYIDGIISEVIENEGVVVETSGAVVQGIFGIGGERTGKLICPLSSPDEILTESFITLEQSGKIVAGGAGVTPEALKKASELGICAIITGSAADTDIIGYLGHDIGVAITGQENIVTSVIITEGFGNIPMANKTFNLLKSLEGRKVSINGATQIRAGVIRPELIAPFEILTDTAKPNIDEFSLEIGSTIRIIREPYFGLIGKVTELPPLPVEIESGATVRILKAKLADGKEVQVPRSNVEIIQE